jgi:hypothetical protein
MCAGLVNAGEGRMTLSDQRSANGAPFSFCAARSNAVLQSRRLTITRGSNEPLTLSVTVDAHYATCVRRIMRDMVVEASWPNVFRGRRFRKSDLAVGCDNYDLSRSRLSLVGRIMSLSK